MKHVLLPHDTIRVHGATLRRIQRVSDGTKGGYVEAEENLSQEGHCWLHRHAQAFGQARVTEDAQVHGQVCEQAAVSDRAIVQGQVYGRARVTDDARVEGKVHGDAIVRGHARVLGEACGHALAEGRTVVQGRTCGDAPTVRHGAAPEGATDAAGG